MADYIEEASRKIREAKYRQKGLGFYAIDAQPAHLAPVAAAMFHGTLSQEEIVQNS